MPNEIKPMYNVDFEPEKIALFEKIGSRHLLTETLMTRHRDSLDFHDVHVVGILRALNDAYEAGFKDAAKAVAQA